MAWHEQRLKEKGMVTEKSVRVHEYNVLIQVH
jgi:hypothetical protein